jgi:hypothetical protein
LYAGRSAVHWFAAASTSGGRFPSPSVTDPTDRPPALASRVHSLVPSVLFGVPSPVLPAWPCPTRHSRIESTQAATPAKDFVPHRDITGGVHDSMSGHGHAGFPGPTSFRPRAFSAPRRLSPPPASRACFIPQPRPGFVSVQGFLPTRSGQRLVTAACLRAVRLRALTGKPAAMRASVDFEALLHESMRSTNSAVKPPPRPLPSSGSLLSQGPARPPCSPAYCRGHPLVTFPPDSSIPLARARWA